MSQIIDIVQAYRDATPIVPPQPGIVRPGPTSAPLGGDSVEFSNEALEHAVELSSLRLARTAAIRSEIEAGTYETPERIEGTVSRLLDVIA